MLSILIFVPIVAGVLLCFLNGRQEKAIKTIALLASLVTLGVAAYAYACFDNSLSAMQFTESKRWIFSYAIFYSVGIDGMSLMMIMLTTLLIPICMLCSWTQIQTHVKSFCISLLILEGSILGVFCSMDIFLFYVFWEAMLIPMYLIVGVWGGPRRIYAAVKLFVYTMAGSLLMLAAIIYLVIQTNSFNILDIQSYILSSPEIFTFGVQKWLFLAFFISFAIKVPIFPFHTWLPDAHVEAPTAGSVILAGVLLKLGAYGMLRFAIPFFPSVAVTYGGWVVLLGVIGIIYGALMAMMQTDIKKLIAYSSVSHLGFVIAGIFSFTYHGIQGGVYQMINHGIATGALFLMVGLLYARTHRRGVNDYGGMVKVTPMYAILFFIVTLSSIGLPGLNGFVGEFLILMGTFQYSHIFAAGAALGVILGAMYMLKLYRDMMFGTVRIKSNESVRDLTFLEWIYLLPLIVLIFVLGIWPSGFLAKTARSSQTVLRAVKPHLSQGRRMLLPGYDRTTEIEIPLGEGEK